MGCLRGGTMAKPWVMTASSRSNLGGGGALGWRVHHLR